MRLGPRPGGPAFTGVASLDQLPLSACRPVPYIEYCSYMCPYSYSSWPSPTASPARATVRHRQRGIALPRNVHAHCRAPPTRATQGGAQGHASKCRGHPCFGGGDIGYTTRLQGLVRIVRRRVRRTFGPATGHGLLPPVTVSASAAISSLELSIIGLKQRKAPAGFGRRGPAVR